MYNLTTNKCRTPNKRFGEIGVKVITRTLACRLTVSDNPGTVVKSVGYKFVIAKKGYNFAQF